MVCSDPQYLPVAQVCLFLFAFWCLHASLWALIIPLPAYVFPLLMYAIVCLFSGSLMPVAHLPSGVCMQICERVIICLHVYMRVFVCRSVFVLACQWRIYFPYAKLWASIRLPACVYACSLVCVRAFCVRVFAFWRSFMYTWECVWYVRVEMITDNASMIVHLLVHVLVHAHVRASTFVCAIFMQVCVCACACACVKHLLTTLWF